LTRIRNAAAAKHQRVDVPVSKLRPKCAHLEDEGLQFPRSSWSTKQNAQDASRLPEVHAGPPECDHRREAHFPSRRALLSGLMDIRPVVGGLGISILTTPKGLMSGRAARQSQNCGELLCEV